MTLVDLANIGQVVGALAVFASLIFVGLQVRQNTKASRATALQMNADYWLSYFILLADKQLSEVYSKGSLGRDELESSQFGQFFFLCRATFMGLKTSIISICLACLKTMHIAATTPPYSSRLPHFRAFGPCGNS